MWAEDSLLGSWVGVVRPRARASQQPLAVWLLPERLRLVGGVVGPDPPARVLVSQLHHGQFGLWAGRVGLLWGLLSGAMCPPSTEESLWEAPNPASTPPR